MTEFVVPESVKTDLEALYDELKAWDAADNADRSEIENYERRIREDQNQIVLLNQAIKDRAQRLEIVQIKRQLMEEMIAAFRYEQKPNQVRITSRSRILELLKDGPLTGREVAAAMPEKSYSSVTGMLSHLKHDEEVIHDKTAQTYSLP